MKKHLLALLVFASFGAYGCGVVDIKEQDALTHNEHMKLGAIYESKGEYELALREYGDAQAIDTKEPRVYFAMGNVYLKMKDYDNAEKEYRKAIELGAAPDFYNNLSWVYIERGQLDKARAAVNEAVAIAQPEKGYIYLDTLGVVLMKSGEYEEAEESFMKAADTVHGKNREAYLAIYGHLVELYKKEGKTEQASIVEEKLKLYETATEGAAKPGI
jgi:tetratricopeptide (TPR) repeat protein